MITLLLTGVALILVLAVVVRALDAVRASRWRAVAAARRSSWERSHALRL